MASNNRERAELARPAYELFGRRCFGSFEDEYRETVAGDLIANLMHLVSKDGGDALDAWARGLWHYLSEVADEEGIASASAEDWRAVLGYLADWGAART